MAFLAFDIIFFWVAKMIIQGIEFMKDIPFKHVYIHQLVRDKYGRKMSKSLGNGIDPLEIIEKYGADSLRFTLAILAAQGKDIKVDEKYFEVYKRFINKIWNASRFVLMNLEGFKAIDSKSLDLKLVDKWLLSRLNKTIKEVTESLENYDFNLAARRIYDFFWGNFCDWYIEASKSRLNSESNADKLTVQKILLETLDKSLRLLHPFMPFVTEEIWQKLPNTSESICVSSWPDYEAENTYEKDEQRFLKLMEVIRSIRNVKADMDIPQTRKVDLSIMSKDGKESFDEEEAKYITDLANVGEIEFVDFKPSKSASAYIDESIEIYVNIPGDIDLETEKNRLKGRINKLNKEKEKLEKKLKDEKFIKNAPENIIEEKERQYEEILIKFERLRKILEDIEV